MSWEREQDLITQIQDAYWRSVDHGTEQRQLGLNEIIRLANALARLRVEVMFGPPDKLATAERKLIAKTFPETVYFSSGHAHNLRIGDLANLIRRAEKRNERSK